MRLLLFLFFLILLSRQVVVADTVKIEFTADDSYSIEVANIGVGDTIESVSYTHLTLPTNREV